MLQNRKFFSLKMDKRDRLMWQLSLSVFLLFYMPDLLRDGMFADGLLYATLANNSAHGIGTFWFPQVFTGASGFHGHPPLVFGIQSIFFRILGDGMWVERLYCFLATILTTYLILNIWRYLFKKTIYQTLGWFPIFLWLIHEDVFISFRNNLLECTMGIFLLATVRLWLPLIREKLSSLEITGRLVTGSLLIGMATLSKGPPGLFPLVFFVMAWMAIKNFSFKKALVYSAFVLLAFSIFMALILLSEDARQSLSFYWNTQIIPCFSEPDASLGNIRGWHGHILVRWVIKIIPAVAVTSLVIAVIRVKKIRLFIQEGYHSYFWFFLVLGLAGTLPFTLSLKQASYYFIPAIPLFTIAIGIALAGGLHQLIATIKIEKTGFKRIRIFSWILLCGTLIFNLSQVGKTDRKYRDILTDIHRIGKEIPAGSRMNFDMVNGIVPLYFSRYYYVIPVDKEPPPPFILIGKGMKIPEMPKYRMKDLSLQKFYFFEKE
jgi:4-amino-4-deoxy-L-arabinose transferase-like glycosyltransferase